MSLVAGFTWTPARRLAALAAGVALAAGLLAVEAIRTRPVRGAVRTFAALISAANTQDLETARSLCTRRYRQTHTLEPAEEGGIVGLPRNVSKNFQAWREGPVVLICPTNRVGPVYRFVPEEGGWKFDGPVGLLMPHGQIQPLSEELDAARPADRGG